MTQYLSSSRLAIALKMMRWFLTLDNNSAQFHFNVFIWRQGNTIEGIKRTRTRTHTYTYICWFTCTLRSFTLHIPSICWFWYHTHCVVWILWLRSSSQWHTQQFAERNMRERWRQPEILWLYECNIVTHRTIHTHTHIKKGVKCDDFGTAATAAAVDTVAIPRDSWWAMHISTTKWTYNITRQFISDTDISNKFQWHLQFSSHHIILIM